MAQIDESPAARMSLAMSKGMPVLEGNLLKKNKWYMKQERRFKLYADGRITYFKETEKKGEIQLSKQCRARKVSRYEVELSTPNTKRTYILMQADLTTQPAKSEGFSCNLDDWVNAINDVVEFIPSN